LFASGSKHEGGKRQVLLRAVEKIDESRNARSSGVK
jgi:hypothetical protein